MMRHTLLYILQASLLTLCACNASRDEAFTFLPVPSDGWEQTDTLRFPIDTLRQGGTFQLCIDIRTSASRPYPFRNASLSIIQQWNGDTARTRHLTCALASSDGSIAGSGVSYRQVEFPADTLSLRAGSCGEILLSHHMSQRVLHGISDVGIRLRRLR